MDNKFYEKEVQCPICKSKIKLLKVKSDAARVVSRDEDFCAHYAPVNPLLYNVWICSQCGYAAMEDKFEKIDEISAQMIKSVLKDKWSPRTFSMERSEEDAIEIYKVALLNLQIRKAKVLEVAKICIRIAWLYRIIRNSKENDFLKFALDSYNAVYETENLPVDNMDEITCMYMIGELNRRLGNISEAGKWLHKVVLLTSDDKRTMNTINMAREQIQRMKDENKGA